MSPHTLALLERVSISSLAYGWILSDGKVRITPPPESRNEDELGHKNVILREPKLYGMTQETADEFLRIRGRDVYTEIIDWMINNGAIRFRLDLPKAAYFELPRMDKRYMRRVNAFLTTVKMTPATIIVVEDHTTRASEEFSMDESIYQFGSKETTAAMADGWLLDNGKSVFSQPGEVGHGEAVLANPQAYGMTKKESDKLGSYASWAMRYTAVTNWMFEHGHIRFSIKGPIGFFEAPRADDPTLRSILDFILNNQLNVHTAVIDGVINHRGGEFTIEDLMKRVGAKTIDRFISAQEEEQVTTPPPKGGSLLSEGL